MKKTTFILGLLFMVLFMMSCDKDKDNNKSDVINPEKYKAVIAGSIETEIEYDEQTAVATGGALNGYSREHLSILADNYGNSMIIYIYPPDNHPNKDDIISIQIKANAPKPWSRDKEYATVFFAQLQYVEEYAIVSYWDASEERDYISYNRPESMSKKVKLWREGKLLKGEIRRIGCVSSDNQLIYLTLDFELRPGEDGLTD